MNRPSDLHNSNAVVESQTFSSKRWKNLRARSARPGFWRNAALTIPFVRKLWRCWMRQTLLVQLECQLLQQLLATPGVLRRRLLRLWFRRMLVWGRARGQQRQAQVDAVRSLCNVALVRAWRTWCNGLAPMTTSPASTASATAVVIPATWGMGEAQGTGSGQVDKPRLAAPSTANTPSRTAPAGSWKTPSFLPRRLFGFGGSPGSGGGGIPVDPPPHYSPPPLMAIHA